MPTQLQLRRGTTTEHSTFSGAVGEVTVDTTKDTLIVHDGATNGGFPLAKEAGATFGNTNVTGNFSFADNAKAIFGAGSDLQIYHSGGASHIDDTGNGDFKISTDGAGIYLNKGGSENMASFLTDGAVTLYYDNAAKLATTATGINVTGGLNTTDFDVIPTGSANYYPQIGGGVDGGADAYLALSGGTSGNGNLAIQARGTYGEIKFYTGGSSGSASTTERLRINSSGKVGIGTSSPQSIVHIDQGAANDAQLTLETHSAGDSKMVFSQGQTAGNWAVGYDDGGGVTENSFCFAYKSDGYPSLSGQNKMTLTPAGNLGIGAAEPTYKFQIDAGTGSLITYAAAALNSNIFFDTQNTSTGASATVVQRLITSNVAGTGSISADFQKTKAGALNINNNETNSAAYTGFGVGGSERMRIDSDGNVCIGNTVANVVSAYNNQPGGGYIRTDSHWEFGTTSNRAAVEIGKNNANNGQLVALRKQGATIGSIGTNENTDLYIAGGDTGLLFNDNADFISPATATGAGRDNAVDLGFSTVRWDDVYATNGTIQTSDANEKQQIAALTDAEITAAKAISQLFKTFKWNDSVAEKGDAARTHTGVIAQDVEAAMTAAGLDAGDYAFFISSTWWETQTEVPAVEADEENGIEAVAAYTRTDTYDTAEEAPEGATERTRMGIRYPELLSFIGAATEQRLSNIETRLTALEAN